MSTQLMTVMQQRRGLSGLADDYSGGDYSGDYGGDYGGDPSYDPGYGYDTGTEYGYDQGSDPSYDPGGDYGTGYEPGNDNSGSYDSNYYGSDSGYDSGSGYDGVGGYYGTYDGVDIFVDQDGYLVDGNGEYVDEWGDPVTEPIYENDAMPVGGYGDSGSPNQQYGYDDNYGGGKSSQHGGGGGGSSGGGSGGGMSMGGGGGSSPPKSPQQPQQGQGQGQQQNQASIIDSLSRFVGSITGHQSQQYPSTNAATSAVRYDPITGKAISNVAGVGAGLGSATGGFVDNLFKTISRNPTPFLIGGAAFALYKMQPRGGSYRK